MSQETALSANTPLDPGQRVSTKNEQDQQLPPPVIQFLCHLCNMHQTCDYFGDHPPFAPTNKFTEDCYVKKDPFAPHPGTSKPAAEYLLVLGANCHRCGHPVCRSPGCSVYYRSTVCLKCSEKAIKEYPTEIQSKIKKKINEAIG